MSDSDLNVGKQAKDIAEAAHTSVDAVKKFASFIDGMFGNAISNSFGLISDKIAYYRFERAVILQDKVEQKLAKRGVEKRYVSVAFGLPIVEKATIEDDESLQEKWANLLTNAQDATYDKPLRRNYATILGDMEAIDAKLFDRVVVEHLGYPEDERDKNLYGRDLLAEGAGLSLGDCENAIRNLMRLGLLKPGVITGGVEVGEHKLSAYKDTELFGVTPMGVDFYFAVNDQIKDS